MGEVRNGSDNSGAGRSWGLWGTAPVGDAILDSNIGYRFIDDYFDLPTAKYTTTQATAGTFAVGDAAGGIAVADSGDTTANHGINVQLGGGINFYPAANKDLYFEARVKTSAITTAADFFLGLAATDTTIIASHAMTTADYIGFKSVTGDGVLLACSCKTSTETTATGATFAADTYVKLGFKVTGVSSIDFYVNGVKVSTVTTNIPTAGLRVSLVNQNSGAAQRTVTIDWVEVFQKR